LFASLRFDRSRALQHRHNVSYLVAYIRRTSRAHTSSRWLVVDVAAFAADYVRKRAAAFGIKPVRLLLAVGLIVTIVGASAFDIAADREDWPFSQYPMFSYVEREPRIERLRVMGVPARPGSSEIALLDSDLIAPFDQCRLSTALARTYNNPARRDVTNLMLADILRRYENARRAGKHDGPPLAAVRLYRMQWQLDPHARNVATPDERQPLREVRVQAAGAGS
jgi:hypothetical protein